MVHQKQNYSSKKYKVIPSLTWPQLKKFANNPISRLLFLLPLFPIIIDLVSIISTSLDLATKPLGKLEQFGISKNFQTDNALQGTMSYYKKVYFALITFSLARLIFLFSAPEEIKAYKNYDHAVERYMDLKLKAKESKESKIGFYYQEKIQNLSAIYNDNSSQLYIRLFISALFCLSSIILALLTATKVIIALFT